MKEEERKERGTARREADVGISSLLSHIHWITGSEAEKVAGNLVSLTKSKSKFEAVKIFSMKC